MTAAALRILVAEDEPAVRRLLRTILATQGYTVCEATDGDAAWAQLNTSPAPDLLLLDLALPGRDGASITSALRESGSAIPILVLSSHSEEPRKVELLDLGADDYVTKPFSTPELLARIRAALRHRLQREGERAIFRAGCLTVDLVRRIVCIGGSEVKLSPKEYDLLRLLVAHAGKVLTHKFLLRELWDGSADVQYLRLYIRALRQKLEQTPERPAYILTEQGVGYRLREADEP
jgi:two-component system KDP operon response regulator KdpE